MTEDGGEEAWLSWRSIPRLAASVASVPLVVGYASVGAARLLGRSVGEVLRGASWALDQIVRNTERSKAVGEGLRKSRKPAKGSRDSRAVMRSGAERREDATPGAQPAGATPRVPEDTGAQGHSTEAPPLTSALEGFGDELQRIVWPDAACEEEWAAWRSNWHAVGHRMEGCDPPGPDEIPLCWCCGAASPCRCDAAGKCNDCGRCRDHCRCVHAV